MASLSEAHLTAAVLYHQDPAGLAETSPSQGCLNCHSRGSNSSWQRATTGRTIAFDTHASHPYGIDVVPGSSTATSRIRPRIDPRLPLFDGKMECQTCHLLTTGTKSLLVPFDEPFDMCLGCHQIQGRGFDRRDFDDATVAAFQR